MLVSVQAIHVAPAGQAPPALTDPPHEDMRACSPLLNAHGARGTRLLHLMTQSSSLFIT